MTPFAQVVRLRHAARRGRGGDERPLGHGVVVRAEVGRVDGGEDRADVGLGRRRPALDLGEREGDDPVLLAEQLAGERVDVFERDLGEVPPRQAVAVVDAEGGGAFEVVVHERAGIGPRRRLVALGERPVEAVQRLGLGPLQLARGEPEPADPLGLREQGL